jgi:hypothetical protein
MMNIWNMWVWAFNQDDSFGIFFLAGMVGTFMSFVFACTVVFFLSVGYPVISGLMVLLPLTIGVRYVAKKYLESKEPK